MCGIVGYISNHSDSEHNLDKMIDKLNHRGPDNNGKYIDKTNGVYLGHTRLSIIDLSDTGSQPMISKHANVLIFNGEIYNHLSLKDKLNKEFQISWKGHSDTEVLLNCIEYFGIDKTLSLIEGMYAFCFYNKKLKKIYLIRDRIGEKPLYYGYNNDRFFFSSELKSLLEHQQFYPKINKQSVNLLISLNYIPAPLSIYEDIFKLKPAHHIILDLSKSNNNCSVQLPYWENIKKINKSKTFSEYKNILKKKLFEVVENELISDVELGVHLSSGIDSALIASIAKQVSKKKINTFSLGFSEKFYDESSDSKRIAKYLDTNHRTVVMSNDDYIPFIKQLSKVYCEPFSDSSQIVTLALNQYASKFVKVSLTGDGGDELFGGYNRYIHANKIKDFYNHNGLYAKLLSLIINKFKSQNINTFVKKIENFLPIKYRVDNLIMKLKRMHFAKSYSSNLFFYYIFLQSHYFFENNRYLNTDDQLALTFHFMHKNFQKFNDIADTFMLFDQNYYLPDDLIVKMERSSMNSSLEIRSPFLHNKIVELANEIPVKYKIDKNKGKIITRSILEDLIPKNLLSSKKRGFLIPLEELFKGDLKEWAESYLFSERMSEHKFFDYINIEKEWHNFQNNKIINFYSFWDIIIFQNWYEDYY